MTNKLSFSVHVFFLFFKEKKRKSSAGLSEGRWAAYPGTKLDLATQDRILQPIALDPSPQGSGPRIIVGRVPSPLWNVVPRLLVPARLAALLEAHEGL